MLWVAGLGFAALAFGGARLRVHALIRRAPRAVRSTMRWEDRGPTPLGDRRFTPQGKAWVDGRLIFANTWKDERSRVYEIDPATMEIRRTFDMPDGAVHTSGMAWDGESLWAVDFRSNRAYRIDLEASLEQQTPVVISSFDTTLEGTSACCLLSWEGETRLAISDFRNSRMTVFVDHLSAAASGSADGHIVFAYENEGFSQGLEFFDGHLWESENKIGRNILNKMDLGLLAETRDARRATIAQFAAPSFGVEDLAWSGTGLWTSDETSFRFYEGFLPT
jgi:glutamine cyclotransferase